MNCKQLKTNNTNSTQKYIVNYSILYVTSSIPSTLVALRVIYTVVHNYDATDTRILTLGNHYMVAKSFKEVCNQSADLQNFYNSVISVTI
jgi:hypothetical protein